VVVEKHVTKQCPNDEETIKTMKGGGDQHQGQQQEGDLGNFGGLFLNSLGLPKEMSSIFVSSKTLSAECAVHQGLRLLMNALRIVRTAYSKASQPSMCDMHIVTACCRFKYGQSRTP